MLTGASINTITATDFKINDKGCLPILSTANFVAQDATHILNIHARPVTLQDTIAATVSASSGASFRPFTLTHSAGVTSTAGAAPAATLATTASQTFTGFSTTIATSDTLTCTANINAPTVGTLSIRNTQAITNTETTLSGTFSAPLPAASSILTINSGLCPATIAAGNSFAQTVASDLVAVASLFCASNGVCCQVSLCNTDSLTKSNASVLKVNFIVLILSTICSKFF